jgi:hypothetical protein
LDLDLSDAMLKGDRLRTIVTLGQLEINLVIMVLG